jgi:serine phosphatase RsbU (regulator of sigma subunit)
VNEQDVSVYKGSTHSIGGYFEDQEKVFHEIEIDFQPGNSFYICSDGYADQFGGPNQKKFMTKNFKALIEEISHLSNHRKSEKMKSTFFDWKAENHQIDDILVIGVTL